MKMFIILLLITIALPLFAENPIEEVFLRGVHPTQMDIGDDRVNSKISRDFIKWSDRYPNGEKTFDEFILTEVMPRKVLPAVKGPDGRIYILDGHHRSTKFTRILKRKPELFKSAKIKVEIIEDYSGKSVAEFAQGLIHDLGKGYFSREIRNKNYTYEELLALLPDSIDELGDDPMRSLIGKVFDELELETDYMKDYIQFYIGEMIDDLELGLDPDNLLSDDNVSKVKLAMFSDRKIVDYMLASPRSSQTELANNKQITAKVNEVLNKAQRRQLVRGRIKSRYCVVTMKLLLR